MWKKMAPYTYLVGIVLCMAVSIRISYNQFTRDRKEKDAMLRSIAALQDRTDALDKRIHELERK